MININFPAAGEKSIDNLQIIEIQLLLEGIYRHYGYDFRDYALATIRRRVLNRMSKEKVVGISKFQGIVLHNPSIMKKLLDDFSISVTEMFRDPGFYNAFRSRVIPILRDLPGIRIWHAGCASGEEVYSMAILLCEEGLYEKTILYATDINENVLIKAKTGAYDLKKMKLYTANYQKSGGKRAFSEYYDVSSDTAKLHDFLRKNIVFSQHNLVTDSSFNEFDVIICRNVMIYFNEKLQDKVHRLLFESLKPSGILALGKKETIRFNSYSHFYRELDRADKLYQRQE